MSKKLIALVLFVAMLISIVPVANAASYTGEYPDVDIRSTGWYSNAVPGNLGVMNNNVWSDVSTNWDPNSYRTYTLQGKVDTTADDLTIEFSNVRDNAQTVYVSGSYSKLQSFYYSYLEQNGVKGKALKIPVEISIQGNNINNAAYINGYAGYYNSYSNKTYITAVLTETDGVFTFKVWYSDSEYYTLKVDWDNTDDNTSTSKTYTVPSLKVVAIGGDQSNNFRASYKDSYYKFDNATATYAKTATPGVLTLNIAAMNKDDRATILKAGDEMIIKLRATDPSGNAYPQGTIITVVGDNKVNMVGDSSADLGSSDKFVGINVDPTYVIDEASCFTLTFDGIKAFAAMAGGCTKADITQTVNNVETIVIGSEDVTKATSNNNVYLYKLANADNDILTLRFSYGTKYDLLTMGLVFQNVARSTSGVTLLADTYTVVVGEKVEIAYIVDDPMAMNQGLKEGWTYVNQNIAYGTGKNAEGVATPNLATIVGKAVGTTYAYAKDYNDKVHLVVINVVAAAPTATPTPAPSDGKTSYVVTASKLNVRSGPGTSYGKVGSLNRNDVVKGVEVEDTAWILIDFAKSSTGAGYVSGKYLAEIQ